MEAWRKKLKGDPMDWLLASNPWTKYKTMTDLLELDIADPEVRAAKTELLADVQVQALAADTRDWLMVAATRNSDPKISYFKLKMLADFGLRKEDLELTETVAKGSEHVLDGLYAVRGQLPERQKKGEPFEKPDLTADVWHCAPCNSPVITAAFQELGVESEQLKQSVEAIRDRWTSAEGWFCHLFFVESQFKKEKIGCPMAGLQALEVFSKEPSLKESKHAQFAFEPINYHHASGKSLYYFGRSKKFWTLKYPFVWYNALYLADILTRFDFLKQEPVVPELIDWILEAQDEQGRFTPTSMFMHYKGWDFANKKEPSPWMTFLCCRILKQFFQ